jgi:hypothetical protein
MTTNTSIVLFGAGGKMGCRITDALSPLDKYDLRYVEPSEEGQERLAGREHTTSAEDEALDGADAVIMAVPDEFLGSICEDVVPKMDKETIVILLDPAVAYAEKLPEEHHVTYFISHPAHPSFFTAETRMTDEDPDWFGGQGRDPQAIVCALHQGPEEDYELGEEIAKDFYAPVVRSHRVTTEQMAALEPALVESLAATCIDVIREGRDEVVGMGVPEQAVDDFLFGHLRIELGIVFGFTDFPFSDGAQEAIENAKEDIFVDDWKERIFSQENIKVSTEEIATPDTD